MYPFARFFSRCVFFFAGFQWISVYGEPDMNVPIMAVAPHSGFFDVLFVTYMNFLSIVGRSGADKVMLFGNLTRMCQPIIVDRDNPSSRSDSIKQIIERVNSRAKYPPISLFTEGTCTNRKAIIKFKTGAFVAGLPVQPVCLRYTGASLDATSWTWDGPGPFTLCWLCLCQFHMTAEFHFLPVYHPNEEEKKDAGLYADNVRKVMANYLNVPLSEYSYEDGRLITKGQKCKLPWNYGDFKILNMRKSIGYGYYFNLKIKPILKSEFYLILLE